MARRDQRTGCLSRARQLLSRYCILVSGRLYGNYLTCCYVLVKLLYCVNAIGQLFLLDVFLGYDYHVLGVHVIRHLLFGEKWIPSERPVIHVKLECGANAQRDGRPWPNVGGTFCESSVIPFLVPRRKLWLTPAAEVPCSDAANSGEC